MSRAMALIGLSVVMLMSALSTPAEAAFDRRPNRESPLGINLAGVVDWATEMTFVDAFQSSRPWIAQAEGKGWGEGGALALDANGWITSLQPGQYATTLMFVDIGEHYPAGVYTFLYEGEADFSFRWAAQVIERAPGMMKVEVDPSKGQVGLDIRNINPQNPPRNLHFIMPGFENNWRQQIFHPTLIERWQEMAVLRFMVWQNTNTTHAPSWSDRPKPGDARQMGKGVALEYMIELANRIQADPWFCIPHTADDTYVRNFALMVKERLHSRRKIYIEYSNEIWNGIFPVSGYARNQGLNLGLSQNEYQAQLFYGSQRSVEIFRIWEDVFGGTDRLVRVLSAQAANPWTGEQVLDFQQAHTQADAIAIAPYFGGSLGNPDQVEQTLALGVDGVLEACNRDIDAVMKHVQTYANMAQARGLSLIAYEGGQHLVGVAAAAHNQELEKLFQAVNRDPRMGTLYTKYYNAWKANGGQLFCTFISTEQYSKWGSWGLLEAWDMDPAAAPKFRATLDFIRNNPRWWQD